MLFKEVKEFEPGKKYKIICLRYFHFEGIYVSTENKRHIFDDVRAGRGNKVSNHEYFVEKINRFYKPVFQRDRIQSAMEYRALQLILKSIIGDPAFTW